MKKRFLIALLVLIIVLSSLLPVTRASAGVGLPTEPGVTLIESDESGVVLELVTPAYELDAADMGDSAHRKLVVPGYENISTAGEYQLPVKHIILGVPPDAQIKARILVDDRRVLDEQVKLGLAPQRVPLDEALRPGNSKSTGQDTSARESGLIPASPVEIGEEAWFRDQRIVPIALYPFQYDASHARLLWHPRLRIEVRFTSGHAGGEPVFDRSIGSKSDDLSGSFDRALESVVLNYETSRRWRGNAPNLPNSGISQNSQDQSITGPRYRISIEEDGIYQITYEQLNNVRDLVGPVDSANLHMSSQGEDVAILVEDGGDGQFYTGDRIKFYGQKFYGDLLAQKYAAENAHWMSYSPQTAEGGFELWQPEFNATMLEKYTDENVYWLQVDPLQGLHMEEHPLSTTGAPTPEYYTDTLHREESHEWFTFSFTGEDTWFWERLQPSRPPGDNSLIELTRTYTATLSDMVTEPISATLRAELVGRRSTGNQFDHHTRVYLNDSSDPIDDNKWVGISRYGFEKRVPQSLLAEGQNVLTVSVLLDAYDGQLSDDVFLDWFEIEYARQFKAVDDQLRFSRNEAGQTWHYNVSGYASPQVEVYDVTDPLKPVFISSVTAAGQVSFETTHPGVAEYYLVGSSAMRTADELSYYQPPDLKSLNLDADHVFITHHDFYTATQTLANYRASQGLNTAVIDVQDLYNEFNFGIFHPIAIKNFLAYNYAAWGDLPSYVLLVGDGHWNFKNYQSKSSKVDYISPTPVFMPPNLSWVDPWQGEVDSANLLATIVGADPLPDVSIARLPVNTVQQLQTIINKIIVYEGTSLEKWQYQLLFIADDADAAGDFAASSNGLISDAVPTGYAVDRIYLDEYASPGDARDAIIETLNSSGASFLNFLGHGAIDQWTHEGIFTNDDISSLLNGTRLPVVLSMDCLDGYWLHPKQSSLVEELLRVEFNGMIASFSPTGLGVATGHDALQRGFYQAVFQNNERRLGPASLSAKLALYASGGSFDLLHTFTVFGDPALRMKIPAAPVYLPITVRSSP